MRIYGEITKIEPQDDGTIKVASVDSDAGQRAIDWIKGIVAEPRNRPSQ